MSFCPTCPECGAFAPWVESETEVTGNHGRLIYVKVRRRCVNGHRFTCREG